LPFDDGGGGGGGGDIGGTAQSLNFMIYFFFFNFPFLFFSFHFDDVVHIESLCKCSFSNDTNLPLLV
jgi:hypothetical protein